MSRFRRGSFDHPPFSSTPEGIFHDMLQAGKNKGELTQMPHTGDDTYIILHPLHGEVNRGDYPDEELFIHRPDFYWRIGLTFIDLELDGPYHQDEPQYSRDQRINKLLLKSGYVLKRYPFERMTKGMLKRIYVETCVLVNGYVKKWDERLRK